ncbi:hypothetical protein ACFL2V_17835 [Pseudomonadota bacterium]
MNSENSIPIILDVEASGFGVGSYPIEVGVALLGGQSFCTLIRPEKEWSHWDEKAERLHHLKRELLQQYGKSVREVAEQLNELLDGQTVYSDAWGNDMSWLSLLFHHAEVTQRFTIDSLYSLLSIEQQEIWDRTKQQITDESALTRHRASADAKILQLTYIQTLQAKD